jgi:transcriptional regulator with XRE-family HTH domain
VVSKSITKPPKKRRERTAISVAVGKAIASQRKFAKMTQQKLAEALGVEKETISRLENGEIAQTVDRLEALSKVLHCSVTDFFEEKKDTNRYAAAIERMIAPFPSERQERVMRCVAEIVGAWEEDRQ